MICSLESVAEQLPAVLLVPGDAVALQQGDEVRRPIACQRRAAEGRVVGKEAGRRGVAVGEVAASAARDADLLGHPLRVVDDEHAQPALPGERGAEQAGRAGADDDRVVALHAASVHRRSAAGCSGRGSAGQRRTAGVAARPTAAGCRWLHAGRMAAAASRCTWRGSSGAAGGAIDRRGFVARLRRRRPSGAAAGAPAHARLRSTIAAAGRAAPAACGGSAASAASSVSTCCSSGAGAGFSPLITDWM